MASRLDAFLHFKWHLIRFFFQNNDPLDIKNYIGRKYSGVFR